MRTTAVEPIPWAQWRGPVLRTFLITFDLVHRIHVACRMEAGASQECHAS